MVARDLQIKFSEQGFNQLQNKLNKIEKSLEKTKNRANSMSNAFGKMGKVIGGLAIAGTVYKMAKSFKSWVGAIGDMDDKLKSTGLGAELFQTVSYKMKEMKLSTEGLTTAMARFNKVSAENGDTRSADERLMSFADHLKSITDPAKRSAEAMKYFGRSGALLIPLFMDGAKGVQALTKTLKEKGSILSQDTIDKAMKVDEAFDNMGRTLNAIKNNTFASLLDGMTDDVSELTTVINDLNNVDLSGIGNALTHLSTLGAKMLVVYTDLLNKILKIPKNMAEANELKRQQEAIEAYKFANIRPSDQQLNKEDQSLWINRLNDIEKMFNQNLDLGEKRRKEMMNDLMIIAKGNATIPDALQARAMEIIGRQQLMDSYIDFSKEKVNTTSKAVGTLAKENKIKNTSATVAQPDALLTQVIMFKNQFILFANQLLGLQRAGSVGQAKAGSIIGRGEQVNHISVTVTGGTNNNETGKAVADAIVKELAKISQSNTQVVKAIASHEQTVKNVTGGGKSAQVNPAPTPQPSPVGV